MLITCLNYRDIKDMKIAIVHEWLTEYAGAERVLEKILEVFPEAELFALVDFLDNEDRFFIKNKPVTTTFIQNLPFAKKHFRNYLPLMPLAISQLNLSKYDLVISSSHAVAKGVITSPNQLHICMCYSPIRYAWDLQNQYLESFGNNKIKIWLARVFLHKIRIWDVISSNGVDHFIAISNFISKRIKKIYNRDSFVIYPPVNINAFNLYEKKEDFYFTASRLVPYKKVDLIAEAFSKMPDKKLYIIGNGTEFEKVKKFESSNVILLGYQENSVLINYMQKAKAFIYCAEEDFGIVPIEAQACGTPVIAYSKGALKETIVNIDKPEPTGILFDEQSIESLMDAVINFEKNSNQFLPENCRKNALRFSEEVFINNFKAFVDNKVNDFF